MTNPQGGPFGPRVLRQWWWDGVRWNGPYDHGGRLRDHKPSTVSQTLTLPVFGRGVRLLAVGVVWQESGTSGALGLTATAG